MERTMLVRMGELTLKGPKVREEMLSALIGNILHRFREASKEVAYRREDGRLYVYAPDEEFAMRVLSRTFGIRSFSPSLVVDADPEKIAEAAVYLVGGVKSRTFAIRARRKGAFPMTSQELAAFVGERILSARPELSVDLERPDVEVGIEVRGELAYVFDRWCPGPGGLPLGAEGTAVSFAGDEEGILASWLAMRRGARLRVFYSFPKAKEVLSDWCHLCAFREGDLKDALDDAEARGYPIVLPRPVGSGVPELLPLSRHAFERFVRVPYEGPGSCRKTRIIYK